MPKLHLDTTNASPLEAAEAVLRLLVDDFPENVLPNDAPQTAGQAGSA